MDRGSVAVMGKLLMQVWTQHVYSLSENQAFANEAGV